jgi:molybdopterin synthase catalytic subunit
LIGILSCNTREFIIRGSCALLCSAGAVSTFLGTTRDNFEGKTVVTLEYEAYAEMAMSCMKQIIEKVDCHCLFIRSLNLQCDCIRCGRDGP